MAVQWPQQYQQTQTQGINQTHYQPPHSHQASSASPPISYPNTAYAQPIPVQQPHPHPYLNQNVQAQQGPPDPSLHHNAQQTYLVQQQYQHVAQQPCSAPYQQSVPAIQGPLPMQTSHNACFNCGALDHWAQNCPHPKKNSKDGSASSGPAAKKQKFNAPVVTKYPVPPHVAQAQAAQQAWRAPAYGQAGYVQHPNQQPVAYGPPTPASAYPSHVQWVAAPSYLQVSPLSYHQQQVAPYQQNPYAQMPPTPVQYYGPQLPAQASSPGQQASSAQIKPPQYQQQHATQSQPSPVAPAQSVSPPMGPQISRSQNGTAASPPKAYLDHHPSPSSYQSLKSTPMPRSNKKASIEPEDDDLRKLDIPDLPSIEGDQSIVAIRQPLPSNFIAADALAPFDPPGLGEKGLCKSRYLGRPDANHDEQNVKDTQYWNNYKNDPVFIAIPDDSKLIPLQELDAIYRPYQIAREPSEGPAERWKTEDQVEYGRRFIGRSWSRGPRDTQDRSEATLDARNHNSRFEKAYSLPSRKRSLSQSWRDSRESPKATKEPVNYEAMRNTMHARAPKRPYPPPTPREQSDSNGYRSRSRSASPRLYASRPQQYSSPPESGYDGKRSDSKPESNQRYSQDPWRPSKDQQDRQTFQPPPPPPPLPPSGRKSSWYDGPVSSPSSSGLANGDPFEPDADDATAFGNIREPEPEAPTVETPPIASPLKLRTERSYVRKREHSIRELSPDEDETPARRQADDFTPKLRKRQPKVAAAYSRRW